MKGSWLGFFTTRRGPVLDQALLWGLFPRRCAWEARPPVVQLNGLRWALCNLLMLGLVSCASPRPYVKPNLEMPSNWGDASIWQSVTPSSTPQNTSSEWWTAFNDPELTRLIQMAMTSSTNLTIAKARVDQARAGLQTANASTLPQLTAGGRVARLEISNARPLTNYNSPNWATVQTDIAPLMSVSYELDLWGRMSGTVEAGKTSFEQSLADFQNVRLVLGADIATNYFNARQADVELDLLSQIIQAQEKSIELANIRYDLGLIAALEKNQLQVNLEANRIQVEQLKRTREQYVHALATLVGQDANSFKLVATSLPRTIFRPALGMPSTLLQRRPDVASAERAVAAANAQIGIAQAAYYPTLTMGSTFGYEATQLANLYYAPSRVWSFGPSLNWPLFDGGRIDAAVAFNEAGYAATVGIYKKAVLTALQEVQDAITGFNTLDEALSKARSATQAAQKIYTLAKDRYEGGLSTSLDLLLAKQALLATQRQETQLVGQRMLVQVFLIKALGGGWEGLKSVETLH
jgi:outer membrane protein, multidrug efflux system